MLPTLLLSLVLIFVPLMTISFLFTLLAGALKVFRPKLINAQPSFHKADVYFTNKDGVALSGWWVEGDGSKPVILMCHGVGANRADLLPVAKPLATAGFGLLLFDFRGHGESGGYKTSFGYRERHDVVAAAQYLIDTGKLKNRRLHLYGLSMGAASIAMAMPQLQTLLAMSQVELGSVVLDSCFAQFAPIIRRSVVKWPWLARLLFLPLVEFVGNTIFQVPALVINPIQSIASVAPAKLLLIHSQDDELIPISHAHRLFEQATEPKAMWELSGILHAEIFLQKPAEYQERLLQYFN